MYSSWNWSKGKIQINLFHIIVTVVNGNHHHHSFDVVLVSMDSTNVQLIDEQQASVRILGTKFKRYRTWPSSILGKIYGFGNKRCKLWNWKWVGYLWVSLKGRLKGTRKFAEGLCKLKRVCASWRRIM